MKYGFHPEAESEFLDAIDYYEDCEKGLGHDFSIEVYSAIEKILAFPNAWTILEDEIRRCLIRRFPYGLIYVIDKDRILFLAVMHLHRDPEYWKNRVE
ncbi:MAG: type II toxin-antitoxin system RelE/ParE family toxin [Desulfobacteraceae bacterium]|nr:MAG: type II toxin-antitoxin system RelE/ParE family toxin [Desulfobacteraceae bacterium]